MRLLLAVDSVMTTEMIMKAVASRPWPRGTRARVISVVEDDAIPAEVWRDAGYSADAVRQEMRRRQGTCFLLIPNLEAALGGFPTGAALANRQADDLGHESFRELAHLGVLDDRRRERAPATADD